MNDTDYCVSLYESFKSKDKLLRVLGKGSTGVTFSACDSSYNDKCTKKKSIKFSKINKKYGKKLETTPVRVDFVLNKDLMYLVTNRITPHINRVYSQNFCKLSHLKKLIKAFKFSSTVEPDFFKGKYIAVTYMELGKLDLMSYLRKTDVTSEELMAILFQLAYTLASIQFHRPGFKHNDLKANNILVYDNETKEGYNVYKIGPTSFYIPRKYPIIKIIDFDFSSTDEISNPKSSGMFKQYNITSEHNGLYDWFYFINSSLNFGIVDRSRRLREVLKSMIPDSLLLPDIEKKVVKSRLVFKPDKSLRNLFTPLECIMNTSTFNMFSPVSPPRSSEQVEKYDSKINTKEAYGRDDMVYKYLKESGNNPITLSLEPKTKKKSKMLELFMKGKRKKSAKITLSPK